MTGHLGADGRFIVDRTKDENAPLLARLRRAEGQIRGLVEMIEGSRYCGDELHQIAAARAALREVAVLLAHAHVSAVTEYARTNGDAGEAMNDIPNILRSAFRQE
ncbi:MAG: metal-sensitive transcriptional regulator [Gluconacetobacter diazotrophicus]|nr:metal-sensitive transcriptional regulator [Gluconacetobacter diazotrophicus]